MDISIERAGSDLRVEKERIDAIVTLSSGASIQGFFFVSRASELSAGPERVGELLNGEADFFPFEVHDAYGVHVVLYNRRHVLRVALSNEEARRVPGYEVATPRFVSVLLSNGHRMTGTVRVFRPEGRDRLSDWARHPDLFRYIETGKLNVLVNVAHVIEVREVNAHV